MGHTNFTTGIQYRKLKHQIPYKPDLEYIQNRKIRVCLSRIRLSDRDLIIEKGRRTSLKKDLRICKLCNEDIETEAHFMFQCKILD